MRALPTEKKHSDCYCLYVGEGCQGVGMGFFLAFVLNSPDCCPNLTLRNKHFLHDDDND